jgi:cellulose synthase/poly-beta-1,6-N-acetylglucosamine synthase-like glycosyltransferase
VTVGAGSVTDRLTVSVVVPTRDRPDQLRRCLAAVSGQAPPAHEVVVVDDASRDPAAVRAIVASVPGARVVVGEGRGPAAARNRGVAAASGAVVCLTDDDCRPASGWLAAILDRFAGGSSATAALAGPTLTGNPHSVFSVASQVVTNHLTASSADPDVGTLGFAPTSNLACWRELLLDVPFDEQFPLAAGEDREWCANVATRGHRIGFEPAAIVWHHQDLDFLGFWRQQQRYGRGAHRYHRSQDTRGGDAGFYAGLVRAGFREGVRSGVLVLVGQVATAIGLAVEAWSARRGR